ncbi:MAG: ABC transporter ATP-binding protein [Burkholderiaceae bacterium]|nr:ABC transporter ATP-binding protein [Burkholderiaceae bacterium]
MAALELRQVSAWYGNAQILYDASFAIDSGEVVALIGRNGAGKTSLLRTAMGLMQRTAGAVLLNGADVSGLPPFRRAQRGLGYVAEDRRIFSGLTVAENLRIAARQSERGFTERVLLELFPNLAGMLQRPGSAMSGGEQQMLAVARTLAANPTVVLLDEPSEGIAPMVVAKMREAVLAMKLRGVATLMSEQNLTFVAAVADRAILIEQGKVVGYATRDELAAPSDAVRRVLALGATRQREAAPTIS